MVGDVRNEGLIAINDKKKKDSKGKTNQMEYEKGRLSGRGKNIREIEY